MGANNLAKRWTKENPYIFLDRRYNGPRRKVLYWENEKLVQTQYSRWLYEQKVGPIPEGKTIHHINGNKMDDRIKNYRLYSHSQHGKHHAKKRRSKNDIKRRAPRKKR